MVEADLPSPALSGKRPSSAEFRGVVRHHKVLRLWLFRSCFVEGHTRPLDSVTLVVLAQDLLEEFLRILVGPIGQIPIAPGGYVREEMSLFGIRVPFVRSRYSRTEVVSKFEGRVFRRGDRQSGSSRRDRRSGSSGSEQLELLLKVFVGKRHVGGVSERGRIDIAEVGERERTISSHGVVQESDHYIRLTLSLGRTREDNIGYVLPV